MVDAEFQRNISVNEPVISLPVITEQDIAKTSPNTILQENGDAKRSSVLSVISVTYAKPNKAKVEGGSDNDKAFINLGISAGNETQDTYDALEEIGSSGMADTSTLQDKSTYYEEWEDNRLYGTVDDDMDALYQETGTTVHRTKCKGLDVEGKSLEENQSHGAVYDLPPDAMTRDPDFVANQESYAGWEENEFYTSAEKSPSAVYQNQKYIENLNPPDHASTEGWEENQFYGTADSDFSDEGRDTNEKNGFYESPSDKDFTDDQGWVDNNIYCSSDDE